MSQTVLSHRTRSSSLSLKDLRSILVEVNKLSKKRSGRVTVFYLRVDREHGDLLREEDSPRIKYIEDHYMNGLLTLRSPSGRLRYTPKAIFRKIRLIASLSKREQDHVFRHALERASRQFALQKRIPLSKVIITESGFKKLRGVRAEKESVTVRGKSQIRYRDSKGRFAKRPRRGKSSV